MSSPWMAYASIPVTCGLIGWFTNWLAIQMTFYPVEFIGYPPYLGWQGVIPRRAAKIAGKAVTLITTRLVSQREVFDRIDAYELCRELEPIFDGMTEEIVEAVVTRQSPTAWQLMPAPLKRRLIQGIRAEIPDTVAAILDEYRDNLEDLFDLDRLVLDNLTGKNVTLLNEMFQRCGGAEFTFIVRSGLYVGFAMGLIQMGVWFFFARWWLLPLVGVAVGYITNWIALKLIFWPLEPRRVLGIPLHGIFLKRQREVSAEYADIVANKIVIPRKILDMMLAGQGAERFFEIIHRHVAAAIDEKTDLFRGVLLVTMGSKAYRDLKDHAVELIVAAIPRHSRRAEAYWARAMDLEATLRSRLEALPPAEFEDILHSCFKEDEFTLILVGAALGLAVGLAQAFYLVV